MSYPCPSCFGKLPKGEPSKCQHCGSDIYYESNGKPHQTRSLANEANHKNSRSVASREKVTACTKCGRYFFSSLTGCPYCQTRHCEECGQTYKGPEHHCPVSTGRYFQSFEGTEDNNRDSANDQPTGSFFDWATRLYKHHVHCRRLRLEENCADFFPVRFLTFTPYEKKRLKQFIRHELEPTVLNNVRAIRYLIAHMDRLVFPHARTVDDRCAMHLARSGKTIRLEGLFHLGDALAEILATSNGALYLRCNNTLGEETAAILARHKGRLLSLRYIQELPVPAAARLALHCQKLQLHGFSTLTMAVAEQLKNHRGSAIGLKSVTTFEPGAAEALAEYHGRRIYFDSIKYPSSDLLRSFSLFQGKVKYGSGVHIYQG